MFMLMNTFTIFVHIYKYKLKRHYVYKFEKDIGLYSGSIQQKQKCPNTQLLSFTVILVFVFVYISCCSVLLLTFVYYDYAVNVLA